MAEKNTFSFSPSDEPHIPWIFRRDPPDKDPPGNAKFAIEVEPPSAEATDYQILEVTEFIGAPSSSLVMSGAGDEIANVILSALDLKSAAKDGVTKILRDLEEAIRPFLHEQRQISYAMVSFTLARRPEKNGEDRSYLWIEGDFSLFATSSGDGSYTATLDITAGGESFHDELTTRRASGLHVTGWAPLFPNDEIKSRLILQSEAVLPSVESRFAPLWEQFKKNLESFWQSLSKGNLGDALASFLKAYILGELRTLGVLTERRHASVAISEGMVRWRLLNRKALDEILRLHAIPQPRQEKSQSTAELNGGGGNRAVDDAMLERVDPADEDEQ